MHLLSFLGIVFLVSAVSSQKMKKLWEEIVHSSTIGGVYIKDRFEESTVTNGTPEFVQSTNNKHVRSTRNETAISTPLQDRIVGGSETRQGEIPWQARVTPYNNDEPSVFDCGAAIISEFWLLSAAHCFSDAIDWERRIIVGKHHLNRQELSEQQFEVDRIYMHENFNSTTKDYDIALIHIKPTHGGGGIQFNKFVQPVCLPASKTSLRAGTRLVISGWGWTKPCHHCYGKETQSLSNVLMKAEILLMDQDKCKQVYKQRITKRMFCAGYKGWRIDACKGDSGGPVVYANNRGHYGLYGIVSWGTGCADQKPGVYTRVTSLLPWIQRMIKLNS